MRNHKSAWGKFLRCPCWHYKESIVFPLKTYLKPTGKETFLLPSSYNISIFYNITE